MSGPSGYPALEPAYIIKASPSDAGMQVGTGQPIGVTYNGSNHVHYTTPSGTITTVPGFAGPKIEAEIIFGADWIYFDPDQKHTRMNVKGIAKTVEGFGIDFKYHGVSAVTPEIAAIFGHAPQTTAFGASTAHVEFEVGEASLNELQTSCWVGNGRFLLEDEKFYVEMRVSKIVASTDMD